MFNKKSLIISAAAVVVLAGGITALALSGAFSSNIKEGSSALVFESVNRDTFDTDQGGRDGSESSPYIIASAKDLIALSNAITNEEKLVEDMYFTQTADINLEGYSFSPIGTLGYPFNGTFDGNGFEISGINIDTTDSFQALFGYVTGTVKNVTVKGQVSSHMRDDRYYDYSYAAGIAGAINNGAHIENCTNYVTVSGDCYSGGIVGVVMNNDVYKVGSNAKNVISGCTNYGVINGLDKYTAGICAYTTKDTEIANCTNEGTISGKYCSGGIVGANYVGPVTGCVNKGEITDIDDFAGGIAAYSSGPIASCQNEGKVIGINDAGGVVGKTISTVASCTNSGEINGKKHTGGVIGYAETSEFITSGTYKIREYTSLTAYNEVTIDASNTSVTIIDCSNSGKVVSTGSDGRVGGIAGAMTTLSNAAGNPQPVLIGCYNTGRIDGELNVGGVVGWTFDKCTSGNCLYAYQLGNDVYKNGTAPTQLSGSSSSVALYWIGRFSKSAAVVISGTGACQHY